MTLDTPADAEFDHAQLAGILRWYVEMGVDLAVGDEPRDRFAAFAEEAATPARRESPAAIETPRPRAMPSAPPARPSTMETAALVADAAAQSARELATSARTLDDLREAMEAFEGCSLKRTASRLVFADGTPGARIMLVGEAPGGDEDKQGKPFVGRAGQLLDRMLKAIGLDRTQVYIANVVPWRPPGNRAPTPQETAICLPFIHRQIALSNPDILVCLGASATQALLGVKEGITRARGRWYDFNVEADDGAKKIRALATLHPAYLLRTQSAKRMAWVDMRALKKAAKASPNSTLEGNLRPPDPEDIAFRSQATC
jgi:uracil-DNA glycosylase family 4